MTMPRRASSDQPRRSALRTARTRTVTTAHDEADRGREPELGGAEALAAGLVEVIGEGRERAEPVRGDRAQQLDESQRVGLRHARLAVGDAEEVGARAASGRAASAGWRGTT